MNSKNTFAFWLILFLTAISWTESRAQNGWYRVFRDSFPPGVDNAPSVDFYPVGIFEMSDGGLMVPIHRLNYAFPPNDVKYNHMMIRTDAAGHRLWTKYDSIPDNSGLYSSNATDAIFNRQFGVFESWQYTPDAQNADISIGLASYNSNGSLNAFKYTSGQAGTQHTTSIAESADGHIIGAGYTYAAGLPASYSAYVCKYNFSGQQIWYKEIDSVPFYFASIFKILGTNDDGMIVCGSQEDTTFGVLPLIAKFDADGNLEWFRNYPDAAQNAAFDIVQALNGDYYILNGGIGNSTWSTFSEIIKVNSAGDQLAIFQISSDQSVYPSRSSQALAWGGDGNLYISGKANSVFSDDRSGFVLKITPDGVLIWARYMDGVTRLSELIRLKDGSMALAGQYLEYENSSDPPPTGVFVVKILPDGSTFGSKITGSVNGETDNDCVHASGDFNFSNALVRIDGVNESYATLTDAAGNYEEPLDIDNYQITIVPPSPYWVNSCLNPDTVNVPAQNSTITANFLYSRSIDCPHMTVDISTAFLQPCFTSAYNVLYQNLGTAIATGSYIDLTFTPGLIVEGASIPYTIEQPGDIHRFQLGNVSPIQPGVFQVWVKVDCQTVEIGQTLCVGSHIYPDTLCLPDDPLWSQASLELTSSCEGDSVRFVVRNKGTGNMTAPQDFIVIEDTAILMTEEFQLNANQEFVKTVAITGAYLRGETAQVPYHPGHSHPATWVEGCNGFNGYSYINEYPLDDADDFVERDCQVVVGSYDPNDKTGYPTGIGADHLLAKNTDLEYMIRFQNTGTYTAFTVLVRDTLPTQLDWTSIRAGVSSHPYKFNFFAPGVVEFRFDDILLPDSNANEAASHGFVRFRIKQQPDLADGTLILNDASIYFDFNDPVVTNTTLHRIGELEAPPTTGTMPPEAATLLQVSPNPLDEATILQLDKTIAGGFSTFLLYGIDGQVLRRTDFAGNTLVIKREGLASGVYGFRVERNGRMLGAGKIVVK